MQKHLAIHKALIEIIDTGYLLIRNVIIFHFKYKSLLNVSTI